MSTAHREQLDDLLDDLPEESIQALLDVLRRMGRRPRLRRWSSAVGSVSAADAHRCAGRSRKAASALTPLPGRGAAS